MSLVDMFMTLFVVSIAVLVETPKTQIPTQVQFSGHDAAAIIVSVRPTGIFLANSGPVEPADLLAHIDASRPVELAVSGGVDVKLEHDIISRLKSRGQSVAIRIETDPPIRPEQKETSP